MTDSFPDPVRAPLRRARGAAAAARTSVEERVGRLPEFVIVGTGRCGTAYTSAVLDRVGLACGHEAVFTPEGIRRSLHLKGDASWLAVPHLGWLRIPAYHVVREPLAVINSLLEIGFFSTDPDHPFADRPHRLFADRLFGFTGDQVADAIRWYVEWNEPCERVAELRYRIEEPDNAFRHIVERHRRPGAKVPDVLAAPPTDRNQKAAKKREVRRVASVGPTDLPDGPMTASLVAMARRFGYTSLD